jgi:hypothetical protein
VCCFPSEIAVCKTVFGAARALIHSSVSILERITDTVTKEVNKSEGTFVLFYKGMQWIILRCCFAPVGMLLFSPSYFAGKKGDTMSIRTYYDEMSLQSAQVKVSTKEVTDTAPSPLNATQSPRMLLLWVFNLLWCLCSVIVLAVNGEYDGLILPIMTNALIGSIYASRLDKTQKLNYVVLCCVGGSAIVNTALIIVLCVVSTGALETLVVYCVLLLPMIPLIAERLWPKATVSVAYSLKAKQRTRKNDFLML